MNSLDEIDSLTRMTRRRDFDDGLMDILNSVVFLLLGLAGWFLFSAVGLKWVVTVLIQQREIAIIALVALAAALILAIHGSRRLISRIRRSYLWRESGYVEPLKYPVRKSVSIVAAFVTIALIVVAAWLLTIGSVSEEVVLRAIVAAASLGTAVQYLGMGIDIRIRRYAAVGIAGMALSAIVLIQSSSFSESWLLLGAGWMAILTASGLWALRQSVLSLVESPSE